MAHLVLKTLTALASSVAVVATAQSLPTPDYDTSGAVLGVQAPMAEPVPAPDQQGDAGGFRPLSPIPMHQYDALPLDGCSPAITESSGTWLRRGLWYADLDAVIMSRTWDSDGVSLIEEYTAPLDQVILSTGIFAFTNVEAVQAQALGETSPGYDGSGRLSLGRFLFRDQTNRDHTFEMVVFGGAELVEQLGAEQQLFTLDERALIGQDPNGALRDQRGLHVPQAVDSSGPLDRDDIFAFSSFDRSNTMTVDYSSSFHSWEWNYNVAQRMRKDRMELQPSGEWIRRASPGYSWDYTAGFRYFDLSESLDWFATDIASVDATDGDTDGSYLVRTSNNLFGLQLGVGLTYETDRWNVTVSTKQGMFINDARATTDLNYVDPDGDALIALNNHSTDLHENGVSYMGTGSIQARYHLRPNLSLRAGWEFMLVTGVSLAPNRADFNPGQRQLHITGDAFYHGISCGTEYYW